jgi:flagellar protein FliL
MAQNTKEAAKKPADPAAVKKSNKPLIMGAVAALAVIGAGAGGWYFSKGKQSSDGVEAVKVAPAKTPIFIPLEAFVVNLMRESTDQYLQLGITLKTFDVEVESKTKASLPEIRSRILQLLTTKTATELATTAGKKKLVKEIITMSNSTIGIVEPPPYVAPVVVPPPASAVDSDTSPDDAAVVAAIAPPPPPPVVQAPVEKKGVIDVLFTSFIIQ